MRLAYSPAIAPPSAVAHGKGKVRAGSRGLADFSEALHIPPVKAQSQEGILIVGADFAAIRPAKPFDVPAGGWLRRMNHFIHAGVRAVNRCSVKPLPLGILASWRISADGNLAGEDGGEFKIHHAKPAVRLPVGHVADIGVVMAHAVFLRLLRRTTRVRAARPGARPGCRNWW